MNTFLHSSMRLLAALCLSLSIATAGDITVFAAASLSDALEEAAGKYEALSGDKVICNFAASSTLARQIQAGARADLFFSADEAQMDSLEKAGLVARDTRKSLLSNTLVIIVSKDSPHSRLSPEQLKNIRRLALADPEAVPAGVYAKTWLKKLGVWEQVAPNVIPAENVRASLAIVEAGNADAGIVYKTDAAIGKNIKVAFEVPKADGPHISYPIALLTDAPNAEGAKRFLRFLESPEGLRIFQRFGFLVAGQDPKQ